MQWRPCSGNTCPLGFRLEGLEFMGDVTGSNLRLRVFFQGFRVRGLGFRGVGVRVLGLGVECFRVQGGDRIGCS